MELKYTYKKGKKYLVGWLLDYPEHPTQGIDIPDLEKHLLEIYGWIKDGTLFKRIKDKNKEKLKKIMVYAKKSRP